MSRDGIEPSHNGFQPSALPLSYPDNICFIFFMEMIGIKPILLVCKTNVLIINTTPPRKKKRTVPYENRTRAFAMKTQRPAPRRKEPKKYQK